MEKCDEIKECCVKTKPQQVIDLPVKDYLENSLKSQPPGTGCRGWKYLQENITPELKSLVETPEYKEITYNQENVNFILEKLKPNLNEEEEKQLGSFVYIMKDRARELKKEKEEQDILSQGYKKILGTEKELDHKKVRGIFDIERIGMLGSFIKKEEKEGTLLWSPGRDALMFLPKGHRTRGLIITSAYIKEA
jgi:hypothetical protein